MALTRQEFELKPRQGLGAILFGTRREQVHQLLPDGHQLDSKKSPRAWPFTVYREDSFFGGHLLITFDDQGRVFSIHAYACDELALWYRGADLFRIPWEEVLDLFDSNLRDARCERSEQDFVYPSLELHLACRDNRLDSVAAGRAGYCSQVLQR